MSNFTTRKVIDLTYFEDRRIDQVAIPWCTTHNNPKDSMSDVLCSGGLLASECAISFGGSDHKWWKDA